MTKKTKWIRYVEPAVNPRSSYSILGYTFTYGQDLRPIPVEVPEEVAEILLEMQDRPCKCHYRQPHNIFEEVKAKS